MKQNRPEDFEQELSRLRPAKVPPTLLRDLERACGPVVGCGRPTATHERAMSSWWRWLLPVGGVTWALLFLLWKGEQSPARGSRSVAGEVRADQVEVDQRLVGVFDTIEPLPDGTAVRFRCRQWSDAVVLKDSVRGVTIENRTPRLEIVPVRFETD
jgi:hypothetical protein